MSAWTPNQVQRALTTLDNIEELLRALVMQQSGGDSPSYRETVIVEREETFPPIDHGGW